jgi:hypothetical protein
MLLPEFRKYLFSDARQWIPESRRRESEPGRTVQTALDVALLATAKEPSVREVDAAGQPDHVFARVDWLGEEKQLPCTDADHGRVSAGFWTSVPETVTSSSAVAIDLVSDRLSMRESTAGNHRS